MRGTYAHPTPEMRSELLTALQNLWGAALAERARLVVRSVVPALDTLLIEGSSPRGGAGDERDRRARTFADARALLC